MRPERSPFRGIDKKCELFFIIPFRDPFLQFEKNQNLKMKIVKMRNLFFFFFFCFLCHKSSITTSKIEFTFLFTVFLILVWNNFAWKYLCKYAGFSYFTRSIMSIAKDFCRVSISYCFLLCDLHFPFLFGRLYSELVFYFSGENSF